MIVAVCPKCGTDLEALIYTTYPPIHAYRCRKCGWTQEERENITRVPIATVERKPITNYDRIRAMTDEELDKFLGEVQWDVANYCGGVTQKQEYPVPEQRGAWLDWLKEEAKE